MSRIILRAEIVLLRTLISFHFLRTIALDTNVIPDDICSTFQTYSTEFLPVVYDIYDHGKCSAGGGTFNNFNKTCLPSSEYFTYRLSSNICKQCFGAQLPNIDHFWNVIYHLHPEVVTRIRAAIEEKHRKNISLSGQEYVPIYRNAVTDVPYLSYLYGLYHPAGTHNGSNTNTLTINNVSYEWYSDVDLSPLTNNYSIDVNDSHVSSNVNYAVQFLKFFNSGRLQYRLVDADRQSCSPDSSTCKLTHVVCFREKRKDCREVLIRSTKCTFVAKFGCHRYDYLKRLDPDVANHTCPSNDYQCLANQTENCTGPRNYRRAVKCHRSECPTCNIGQWSEWSQCNAAECGVNGVQVRNREIIDLSISDGSNANQSIVRKMTKECVDHKLEEKRNCTLLGCAELENSFVQDNTNFM